MNNQVALPHLTVELFDQAIEDGLLDVTDFDALLLYMTTVVVAGHQVRSYLNRRRAQLDRMDNEQAMRNNGIRVNNEALDRFNLNRDDNSILMIAWMLARMVPTDFDVVVDLISPMTDEIFIAMDIQHRFCWLSNFISYIRDIHDAIIGLRIRRWAWRYLAIHHGMRDRTINSARDGPSVRLAETQLVSFMGPVGYELRVSFLVGDEERMRLGRTSYNNVQAVLLTDTRLATEQSVATIEPVGQLRSDVTTQLLSKIRQDEEVRRANDNIDEEAEDIESVDEEVMAEEDMPEDAMFVVEEEDSDEDSSDDESGDEEMFVDDEEDSDEDSSSDDEMTNLASTVTRSGRRTNRVSFLLNETS